MRFDLEIPSTNNYNLVFIKEGNDIPTSVTPIVYHKNNDIDLFPSSFLSSEVSYFPKEFMPGGYETIYGPEIRNPKSDTFILTDVVKYSSVDGTDLPLFYKHVIGESITDGAIRIVDFFGSSISKNLYLIETKEDHTNIYINKQGKILFVEYVSDNSLQKVTLNLQPVYDEESWSNILAGSLDNKRYIFRDNIISVKNDNIIYIAYLSDTKLFRHPYGNLDDPWYAGVLNADFTIVKENISYRYWIPEFYLQDLDTDYRYKKIDHKKCKKLLDNYIQTEYPIGLHALDSVTIFIYNYYSKKLKYAFTSKKDLDGSLYKDDIYYLYIEDISLDGIIKLPIKLDDEDIAYASFYTDEYYYEYKGIDLKTGFDDGTEYIVIYLNPYEEGNLSSVSHISIPGVKNGIQINTISECLTFLEDNNYYEVAKIALINPYLENNNGEYIEIDCQGNKIIDKYNACKSDIDVLYNDLINRDLSLPSNDTLVAVTNIKRLVDNDIMSYTQTSEGTEFDNFTRKYFDKMKEILNKNLDASTFPILEINL